ncbi:hypothetical protein FQN54_004251 [Arachnomyces sp. PD_36]|nr:hypothetical protein FQN54_004251 [Arachnomyces sp. PD_36]
MVDNAQAQAETSLDVDLMILDYLMCSCIRGVLHDRDAQRRDGVYTENTQRVLSTFTEFQDIFKVNHPGYTPSEHVEIKLQILTFANLFLCRQIESPWSPCPEGVRDKRAKDTARAADWLRHNNHDAPFDPWNGAQAPQLNQETLGNNRRRMISEMQISREDVLRDLETTTSLLDILPKFMTIISTLATYCRSEAELWGKYASEFMLQASLEQFYVYGATKPTVVDEAFAWDQIVSADRSQTEMDTVPQAEQKATYKALLLPDRNISWNWHLREVANKFSLLCFEDAILDLLELLLNLLPKPILTQLEEGKLEGLSESETADFKKRVDIV